MELTLNHLKGLPKLLASSLFLLITGALFAQSGTTYSIQARASYDGNDVILRWAPGDFTAWKWANEHGGFDVIRTKIRVGDTYIGATEMLASQTTLVSGLSPWPEAAWQTIPDTNMAGIVAGSIYGDSLEVVDLANTDFMTVVNTNEARQNRFGFSLFACDQNFDVAKAAGLGYVDTSTLQTNAEYIYVVNFHNLPNGISQEKGVAKVFTSSTNSLPAPPKPLAQAGDKAALLMWDKQQLSSVYSSYVLERSDNGGQSFQSLGDSPFISLSKMEEGQGVNSYLDSLDNNTTTYVYRVKGKSTFGTYGPPSDTVQVKGRPAPLVDEPLITEVVEVGSSLQVKWSFPVMMESNTMSFEMFRADRIDGAYTLIGSAVPSAREFLDNSPLPANYYVLKVKDINGTYRSSLPKLGQGADDTPPAQPTGISGVCDRNGTVTVSWSPNGDADIFGYRVFMSDQNVEDTAFVQITSEPVRDTFFKFQVELTTLTKQMYFRVKAVDFRENRSPSSADASVQRVDIVAPSSPTISDAIPRPDAVILVITASTSVDIDRYVIEKRAEDSRTWQQLAEFTSANMVKTYVDSVTYVDPITRRHYYYYRVLAYDADNNVSSSQVVRSKPADNGIRGKILNLNAMVVNVPPPNSSVIDNRSVWLTWEYLKDADLAGFQIFRSIDNNAPRSYKFISLQEAQSPQFPNIWSFEDADVEFKNLFVKHNFVAPNPQGNGVITVSPIVVNNPVAPQNQVMLRYQVMAVFFDGGQSEMSNAVQVIIN